MFRKHLSKTTKMFIGAAISAGIVGGMVFGTQLDFSGAATSMLGLTDGAEIIAAAKETTAFQLSIDGTVIGTVTDDTMIPGLVETAMVKVEKAIGYTPAFDFTTDIHEITILPSMVTEESALLGDLEKAVKDSLDEILVRAYVLKIDDFTVTLESEEALEEVLAKAQSTYVQDDSAITVNFEQDPHNSMVMVPEVNVLSKSLPDERVFMTSAMLGEPMEDLEASDDEFLEAVVTEVVTDQEIIAIETFVSEETIIDVATAIEMITKEHAQIKTYTVVKGDVPSVIAEKNNMTTEALYEINPGLRENARVIQIGDELTVLVPEPELFVKTVEDVIYTEIIDREIIYVNDPDAYIGTYDVIEAGADGIIEVRATVTKENGTVINHEITSEKKILDPVTETQSRGVKALPVTTATGKFEVPMLTYTFTSDFGWRWGRQHKGIDLAAPTGTAIKASDGGRIIQVGWDGGYGYSIEIDHGNGFVTKYAHLSKMYVSLGEEVSQYETIGTCGNTGNSTGPHLHFEILKWGTPVDPEKYITP